LIGDYLIEVNTTCPTGIRAVQRLYGHNPAEIFWDKVAQQQRS
jgi:glutathione synthase/RimK-type ligase-like ATP-grasp enzyme